MLKLQCMSLIIWLPFPGISSSSLSYKKATFSSSSGGGSSPATVVDGNFNGYWTALSCWESSPGDMNPYWMVDLGGNYYIDHVTVTNRVDCCADRLHSVEIMLYAANPLPDPAIPSTLCAFVPGPVGNQETVPCNENTSGRFVKINGLNRRHRKDLLTICEVTVVSLPNPVSRHLNLARGKSATASSSGASSTPSRAVDGDTTGWSDALTCWQALNNDASPYWIVDLKDTYHVSYVTISARLDCCVGSLHDLEVLLYEEDPLADPTASSSLCALYPGPTITGATIIIMCAGGGTSGRYVKINALNRANDGLQFCEVGIYSYTHISSQCLPITSECEDNKRIWGTVVSLPNTTRSDCAEACYLRQSCFGFNYNEGSLTCELVKMPVYELYSVEWRFCDLTLV